MGATKRRRLDMGQHAKEQKARTEIARLTTLLKCPHYNDDPACELCWCECPVDVAQNALNQVLTTLT